MAASFPGPHAAPSLYLIARLVRADLIGPRAMMLEALVVSANPYMAGRNPP